MTKFINQQALVSKIKLNDEAVLKQLYQDNYTKVEAYVLKNNGTMPQAKDLYQDAFITLWQNIKQDKFIPKNESALQGYLYQIAKNKWLDFLRSSRYKKTNLLRDEDSAMSESFEEIEKNTALENEAKIKSTMEAFKKLGSSCQEILKEFYFSKTSLREIAEKLNIGEASAKNKKYRCLQKLKEIAQTQINTIETRT
ncbi:MAG: hypothetical protein CMC74_02435 [Flavobacteriaceae bacterium]|nr:hypothetical protein [Flavobacteriaceae bacterium]|tara:strand:+ start:60618 stop:61208 length:591 start_codon:yes stop_codon:yes gene_type:complete